MKNLLLFLLLLIAITSKAQKKEPALAEVHYKLIHITDTTEKNNPYTESFVLLLGKRSSLYSSYDARQSKSAMEKDIKDQIDRATNPNELELTITEGRPTSPVEFFQDLSAKKIYSKEFIGPHAYLYDQRIPEFNWQIQKDTASIAGLKCQKAETTYMGRRYQAWFCPDLPFHSGPWKFSGLPGLIVQVKDTKSQVIFEYAGFTDVSSKQLTVGLPENATKLSEAEYAKLKKLERTDPGAFYKMAGTAPDSGPFSGVDKSKIKAINVKRTKNTFSPAINNPIELPE
ncbi:GLPGLI family protein [Pedobacter deserti]|uniref:GLPGLI family protein n=1 Tax=Pedobacter deserti TaxID=2817382 RepID=UPI00210D342A|nr:GLPGLI family protein [Pedobacter sp. SYSU D00382]